MTTLEPRARAAYERARLRAAFLGASPALLLTGVTALFTRTPHSALLFGAALFTVGTLLLWRGRPFHAGVLPGAAAGQVPLVFALAANRGHACVSGHCSTWCVPACIAGGVLAAAALSWFARRRGHGLPFFAGAALTCLATGAMGCSCAGASGVLGLCAGFALTSAPWVTLRALRR